LIFIHLNAYNSIKNYKTIMEIITYLENPSEI
jgi:hypothetical protein